MNAVSVKLSAILYWHEVCYIKSISLTLDTEADTGLISKYETPSATGRRCADVQLFFFSLYCMKNYYHISPSTGKRTGVRGYDYGDDYITIYFTSGSVYTYTLESCGEYHLSNMKRLADAQSGLNTYVTRNKPPYASKS